MFKCPTLHMYKNNDCKNRKGIKQLWEKFFYDKYVVLYSRVAY